MGVGVSDWRLARAVSLLGQLGVVSGTAIDSVFVRRLQDGDPGGHLRRAMAAFPMPGVAAEALRRWFRDGGKPAGEPYKALSMYHERTARARQQLTMLASFVEVWLAREGHEGPVGINLLTKLQLPNPAVLYGAMLAGVSCVLMGAGIPRDIPAVLDAFAEQRPATLKLDMQGSPAGGAPELTLNPRDFWQGEPPPLVRPAFLAIISSDSLGTMLARKASGRVDGFVIEGSTAGGHNAPPRGALQLDVTGQPMYGPRDLPNLDKIRELELPFWLAGGVGSPGALQAAMAAGAAGIQVGTLFAYTDESGLTAEYKQSVLSRVLRGEVEVYTDPLASPTGYPFKVVRWADDPAIAGPPRERVCDLGYLRVAYAAADGKIGYRCAAEPVDAYVKKGGDEAETVGRRCLCNALMANIGHAQLRKDGVVEQPLITSGDDLTSMAGFLDGRTRYTAADVVEYLLG